MSNTREGVTGGGGLVSGVLSTATREAILALAERYPSRRTALLPALKLAQAEVGYLPPHVTAEVANLVGVPHAAAAELVSFYTMLRAEPSGATHVVVCAQLPCALKGAEQLLRELSSALGIRPGETTPDGAVTLERTAECFGSCHRAPMARVGDDYWENLAGEGLQRLITHLSLVPAPPEPHLDRPPSGRAGLERTAGAAGGANIP